MGYERERLKKNEVTGVVEVVSCVVHLGSKMSMANVRRKKRERRRQMGRKGGLYTPDLSTPQCLASLLSS
jgi:hypothetical protein